MTAVWVSAAVSLVVVAAWVLLVVGLAHRRRPVPQVVRVAERYSHQVVALFPARSKGAGLARFGKEMRRWDWRRYEVTLHRAGGR